MNINYRNKHLLILSLSVSMLSSFAQENKKLSLDEALNLGLENSKTLKLSQKKIDKAVSVYNQSKDAQLPTAKAGITYNHAEIPSHTLQIGSSKSIELPKSADAILGNLSVEQLIFGGNKLRYARESTDLLKKTAELNLDKDKEEISIAIIKTYLNLYKLQVSQAVVRQNIVAIDKQITQTQRFFEQGLVTKNDLLRLQLQKANIELTRLDILKNENIVNYDLDILLGFPQEQKIETTKPETSISKNGSLASYIALALNNRQEIKQTDNQVKLEDINLKSVKSNLLPTLGLGISAYYINPNGSFIPKEQQFIAPISAAANLSWNFGNLWTNKHKVTEASIRKDESLIHKEMYVDKLKSEVNESFQNYDLAIQKIAIIQTSVDQAEENDRIVQSKYTNSTASITDRIDANTQLFQTKINLELAKADAQLAYYDLLKSSGQLFTK